MSLFRLLPIAMLGAFVVTVSACGNLESIHRTTGTKSDGYKLAFVDAKQRAIVVNDKSNSDLRICAEPSPDALASVAASFSGSLTGSSAASESLAAAVTNSLSGSAASIGLRTQSIQLMRDALYRLCEAHANGAIDGFQMRSLQMRYQNMIIGLLAIEQLTGVVRAPAATTGSSAGGSVTGQSLELSKHLAALDTRRDALIAEVAAKEKTEGELKAAFDSAAAANALIPATTPPSTAKTAAQDEEDKAKAKHVSAQTATAESRTKLKDTELMMNGVRTDLAIAHAVGSSTSANAKISERQQAGFAMDKDTAKVISEAVSGIVVGVIEQDNSIEACMEFLSEFVRRSRDESAASNLAVDGIFEFCSIKLKTEEEILKKSLETYGGNKLGKIAAYLADPMTRDKALAAFPAAKPPSLTIANGTYVDFRTNINRAATTGKVDVIQTTLNFHLKTPGKSTDLKHLNAALKIIENSISG